MSFILKCENCGDIFDSNNKRDTLCAKCELKMLEAIARELE